MESRYYVVVGNCYVNFMGIWHEPNMKADYHKATPFLDEDEARAEANTKGLKKYKVIRKMLE